MDRVTVSFDARLELVRLLVRPLLLIALGLWLMP